MAGVTPSGPNTIVTCVEEERLGFEEGQLVQFSEVAGMTPLNSAPPARIRSKTAYSIEIELDTSEFPQYTTGTPHVDAGCGRPCVWISLISRAGPEGYIFWALRGP